MNQRQQVQVRPTSVQRAKKLEPTIAKTAAGGGARAVLPSCTAAVATAAAAGAAGQAAVQLEAPMDEEECRRFVESIRREEFGVGVPLAGEAAQLSGRLAARTGRALQRLAAELYSSDSHFVMELVQNADDNRYPPGVVPSLEFLLQRGAITAANNEAGFAPQHLRALCDVGASTKARVTGYIGQKGIGFKSVFRVSSAPQVHSRNFHVCFDLSRHGSLGYCLPDWCPLTPGSGAAAALTRLGCGGGDSSSSISGNVRQQQELQLSEEFFPYGTAIVLPLRHDMAGHGRDTGAAAAATAGGEDGGGSGAAGGGGGGGERGAVLRRRFADLSPTLLLFLQRLQRITVRDETGEAAGAAGGGDGARVVEMERRGVAGQPHLVQLLVHNSTALPAGAPAAAAAAAAAAPSTAAAGPAAEAAGAVRSTSATTWAVVTASLQPQLPRAGVAVSETRVSLAFCLGQAVYQPNSTNSQPQGSHAAAAGGACSPPLLLAPSWRGGRPPQQPVFAFLPLRSYGLRFVVQGDWVVPSSRESLDADSPWNQNLRAQLPGLFLRALDVFKRLPPPLQQPSSTPTPSPAPTPAAPAACSEVFWADQWLRCVPLEGEAQGFFAGLPHSIATLLRAAPCIPLAGGGWAAPGDTAVCSSSALSAELLDLMLMLPPGTHAAGAGAAGAAQTRTASTEAGGGAGAGSSSKAGGQVDGSGGGQDGGQQRGRPALSVLGLRLVAPEARVLYESRPLRALLGVREFGPMQLLEVLRVTVRSGGLARGEVGLPWLARALSALLAATASGSDAHHHLQPHHYGGDAVGPQLTRGSLLRELRGLAVLPLRGGGWASLDDLTAAGRQEQEQQGQVREAGLADVLFFPLPSNRETVRQATAVHGNASIHVHASNGKPDGGAAAAASAAAAVDLLRRCGLPADHIYSARRSGSTAAGASVEAGGRGEPDRPALLFLDERLLSAAAAVAATHGGGGQASVEERSLAGEQRRRVLLTGLEELGVQHLTPQDLVFRLALPALTSETSSISPAPSTPAPSPAESGQPAPLLVSYMAMPLLAGMLLPWPPNTPMTAATAAAAATTTGTSAGTYTAEGGRGASAGHHAQQKRRELHEQQQQHQEHQHHQQLQHQQQSCQQVLQLLRQRCAVLTSSGQRVLSHGVLLPPQQPPQSHALQQQQQHPQEDARSRGAAGVLPATPYAEAVASDQQLAELPGGGSRALYLPAAMTAAVTAAAITGPGASPASPGSVGRPDPSIGELLPLLLRSPGAGAEKADAGRKRGAKRSTAKGKGKRGAGAAEERQTLAAVTVAEEGEEEWPLLDEVYVRAFPGLAAQWHWLFQQLGVFTFPRPAPRRLLLTSADLPGSPWGCSSSAVGALTARPGGPWVVLDWSCPPLTRLMRQAIVAGAGPAADRFFQLLAAHWEHCTPALEARLVEAATEGDPQRVGDGRADSATAVPTAAVQVTGASLIAASGALGGMTMTAAPITAAALGPSTLAMVLRNTAWLPAILPRAGNNGNSNTAVRALLRPSDAYAPLPHVRRLLHDHVPYVDLPYGGVAYGIATSPSIAGAERSTAAADGANSGSSYNSGGGMDGWPGVMLHQLGVRSQLTPACVLRLLSDWSRGG
ncbi:hypothetical protein Agub_g5710, partial [Astrephomene gubernaculifera]